MPLLQSSNISILKEVKFTKIAVFVTDLVVSVYTKGLFFTRHSLLINFISTTDRSQKQPRPMLQDQDQDLNCQDQDRRISVSRPRPQSRGLQDRL